MRPYHVVFNCPRLRTRTPGFDVKRQLGIPDSAITLAYMGGIGKMNCLEEAILALAEVPQVYFLIWGWAEKSYVASLKLLASQWGVEKRVLFLGQINEAKWETLDSCDIGYCVYRPEKLRLVHAATASNKLMESLASGLPVITRGTADFKDIVEKYQAGLCLAELSTAAIVTTLRSLANNPMLRKRMGDNGVRAHREFLNYEYQFAPVVKAISFWVPITPSPIAQNPRIAIPV